MRWALVLALGLVLGGCGEEVAEVPPPPQPLTREVIGHYCGMIVADHEGPKAQIFVSGASAPVWFSSVRDAIAFTLLPEEPKHLAAIWVTDMGKASDWSHPENDQAWIDAKSAFYVLGSSVQGGMGQAEAVPFAGRAAAEAFAQLHGGRVVAFADIPQSYILGGPSEPSTPAGRGSGSGAHGSHER